MAEVAERHGMVFVAPKTPLAPLGRIAEAEDDSFAVGELAPIRARASVGLLADNFLDMAHFPFVHRGTFGADEAAEVPRFEVARDGWAFTARHQHQFANREDPGVAAGIRPLIQSRRLTYRLDAPFHLQPPASACIGREPGHAIARQGHAPAILATLDAQRLGRDAQSRHAERATRRLSAQRPGLGFRSRHRLAPAPSRKSTRHPPL